MERLLSKQWRGWGRRAILWLGWLLAGSLVSAAANVREALPTLRPALRVFTDRDGLPQNTVGAMTWDRQGRLWVGTQDGLACYNGQRWRTVAFPATAKSRNIRALLATADDALWVGTLDGVLRLQAGQWTSFGPHEAAETGKFPGREVYALLEEATPQGPVVWAGGDGGVARFSGGRWEAVPIRASLPSVTVKCLARTVDAAGQTVLWIGTTNRGLVRQVGDEARVLGLDTGLPGEYITCLLAVQSADGQPQVWGGTQGGGVFQLDGQGAVLQRFDPKTSPLPNGRIQCLAQSVAPDGARHLWIGMDGSGVACYTGRGWQVYTPKQGLPAERVFSLLQETGDVTPAVWIGTGGGGLARCDLEGWQSLTVSEGLPDRRVYAFLESAGRNGKRCFWIGTSGGLLRAEAGQLQTFTRKDGLPGDTVLSLAETRAPDGASIIWAGCDGGLAKWVGNRWQAEPTPCDGKYGTVYFSLAVTNHPTGQPILWAFTYDGVQYLENGRWQRVTLPGFEEKHIPTSVMRDPLRPDVLWGSVYGMGVLRYADGQWTQLPRQGLPTDLLLGVGVFEVQGQPQLWVGTQSQGVVRYDPERTEMPWTNFSEQSQPPLPNNHVYGVVVDALGRLYFPTNRGVAQWTFSDGSRQPTQTRTFTMDYGLPSNECNQGAFYRDSAGRLWIGTVAGAAVYDPGLEITPPLRSLVMEQVFVNGRPARLALGQRLAYADNNLAFEYALLDFTEPQAIRYRVQLDGYDRAPSDWVSEAKAVYTNVPAGNYRLRIWARDARGRVVEMSPLAFEVLSPWWLRWWAWVGYVGCGVGLVYGGVRWRLRALERQNAELEAKVAERTAALEAAK
ncbi:MAG: two-component regulator propeller domain-containing protein, partial [Chloracidobacterium sp.]